MNANADFIVSLDKALFTARARRAIAKPWIGIRPGPIRVVDVPAFVGVLEGTIAFSPLVLPAACVRWTSPATNAA